jgi:hypothetical protein
LVTCFVILIHLPVFLCRYIYFSVHFVLSSTSGVCVCVYLISVIAGLHAKVSDYRIKALGRDRYSTGCLFSFCLTSIVTLSSQRAYGATSRCPRRERRVTAVTGGRGNKQEETNRKLRPWGQADLRGRIHQMRGKQHRRNALLHVCAY